MYVSDQARALWSREDMRGGVMRGAGRALRFELAHRSEAAACSCRDGVMDCGGLCGGCLVQLYSRENARGCACILYSAPV